MKNGYALASDTGLHEVGEKLSRMSNGEREYLRGKIRIGLQWDTEVTVNGNGHLVTQAYCSALPVAYSPHSSDLWRSFASLVLEAAYEATLAAAVINLSKTGNNRVYLTLLGGGAFGNDMDWILSSMKRALEVFKTYPLQVNIVSYGAPNASIRGLV